eukprot:1281023-Rhodomonas_salina.1
MRITNSPRNPIQEVRISPEVSDCRGVPLENKRKQNMWTSIAVDWFACGDTTELMHCRACSDGSKFEAASEKSARVQGVDTACSY